MAVFLCCIALACSKGQAQDPPSQDAREARQPIAANPIIASPITASPFPADTIVVGAYVPFVRPLRSLGVQQNDADDFTPYVTDALYVTCIGFVGKLDLKSGEYAWSHENLYSAGQYNDFGRPRIVGDSVEFHSGDKILRVARLTGERLP